MLQEPISLEKLYQIIQSAAEGSGYTAGLVKRGPIAIGRKVTEEAVEVLLASAANNRGEVIAEMCDLFNHTLVLAYAHGITLDDLAERFGVEHSKKQAAAFDVTRLFKFEPRFHAGIKQILAAYQETMPPTADVLLLGHLIKDNDLEDIQDAHQFSQSAREFHESVTQHNQKVKLLVPAGSQATYVPRQNHSLDFPIVVILNSLSIPVCLKLISRFLQQRQEQMGAEQENWPVEIHLAVNTPHTGEVWCTFTGDAGSAREQIDSLLRA